MTGPAGGLVEAVARAIVEDWGPGYVLDVVDLANARAAIAAVREWDDGQARACARMGHPPALDERQTVRWGACMCGAAVYERVTGPGKAARAVQS